MGKKSLELHQLALSHKLSGTNKHYTDEQKHEILESILVKGMPIVRAAEEFGVSRQAIWKWIRIFAEGNGTSGKGEEVHAKVETKPTPMSKKNPNPAETPEEELARLRRENAQLQEALKMAEWSNHAKDVMIDIAEKTFNIPIRKKSGAKQ